MKNKAPHPDPPSRCFGGSSLPTLGEGESILREVQVSDRLIATILGCGSSAGVPRLGGGRADRYGKFLLEEVRPFMEREYRVDGGSHRTGIGGSSLGGLVSLYLGMLRPDVFGKIAALSPSVWWNQRVIHTFAAGMQVESRPRIWLDIGTREGPRIVEDVERYRDILLRRGWQYEQNLHYERIEGAEHTESAWAKRVGPFLRFLYPAG